MRVRLEALTLVGTSREFTFRPGLNIVTGPIATGKTTLLRMCRAIFGSSIDRFPPEARRTVSALSAKIAIGGQGYQISRPFVSTPTAFVDIAGPGEQAWRLPASAPAPGADQTFGQWLLHQMGLPVIRVPLATTQPDSPATPVSINDYFLYCTLNQDEIDSSVFGHHDFYKNTKRKYVFGILYGLYSIEIARVQEELREVVSRMDSVTSETRAFDSLLAGTPWENRATLEELLVRRREELRTIESETRSLGGRAASSHVQVLRTEIIQLDGQLAELQRALKHEADSIEELERLGRQLEFQISKLTRSIVTGELLLDFEFIVCPRCGRQLEGDRGKGGTCLLCLQQPAHQFNREVLVQEQNRVTKQILETQELANARRKGISKFQRKLENMLSQRERLSHELELQSESFVSDRASLISEVAAKRAEALGEIRRVSEYLLLYERLDTLRESLATLQQRRGEIEAQIERLSARGEESELKIRTLERNFNELLERFNVPQFGDIRMTRIDRDTFLPVVHGRKFDELSSQGLKVLVNVAHAIAHQITAIEQRLALPGILFIDGLTSNVSREDVDLTRVLGIYDYLFELSDKLGNELQIIVSDQDIPESGESFVRVRLGENERLIPPSALEKIEGADVSQSPETELRGG